MFVIGDLVQVAEMADAQPPRLEHEDRIAIRPRALAKGAARVGGDVAHQHRAEVQFVLRRAVGIGPSCQHMRDARVGIGGPMGGMGIVHRHHIRHHIGIADEAGVIGDRHDPARRFQRKAGMAQKPQPHRSSLKRIAEGRGKDARLSRGQCDAGRLLLRGQWLRGKDQGKQGVSHGRAFSGRVGED